MRSASRIIPAQVPKVGMPSFTRRRSGSSRSKVRASLAIVVDSPPGSTSPSHRVQLGRAAYGERVSTPSRVSVARCSRTSPWSANTPIEATDKA